MAFFGIPPAGWLLTTCQLRMARAALDWTFAELAIRTGIAVSTLRRMEQGFGIPRSTARTAHAIREVYEAAGLVFIPDEGEGASGPGVRFGNIDHPMRRQWQDDSGEAVVIALRAGVA